MKTALQQKTVISLVLALLLSLVFVNADAWSQQPLGSPATDAVRATGYADAVTPEAQDANVVTYTYDRSGRLTSANYGDGALLVYSYDPGGNLTQVTDHFGIYLPVILRQSN
jgi:YD repeat-containing protein